METLEEIQLTLPLIDRPDITVYPEGTKVRTNKKYEERLSEIGLQTLKLPIRGIVLRNNENYYMLVLPDGRRAMPRLDEVELDE